MINEAHGDLAINQPNATDAGIELDTRLGSIPEAVKQIPVIKLALNHAEFWKGIISALIDSNGSEVAIKSAFRNLQPEQRDTYAGAFAKVQERLSIIHTLYQEAKGEEIELIVRRWLEASEVDEATIVKLTELGLKTCKFTELSPGVAVLKTDPHFFYEFTQKAFGQTFYSDVLLAYGIKEGVPSVILCWDSISDLPEMKDFYRHEVYHLVQWALEDSEFLPAIAGQNTLMTESFRMFRQEVGAHLMERGSWTNVNEINMIYTRNPAIEREFYYTRDFYQHCCNIAEKAGLDQTIFIFAAANSQSFADFRRQCALVSQINLEKFEHFNTLMYDLFTQLSYPEDYTHPPAICEFLDITGCSVTPEFYLNYVKWRFDEHEALHSSGDMVDYEKNMKVRIKEDLKAGANFFRVSLTEVDRLFDLHSQSPK